MEHSATLQKQKISLSNQTIRENELKKLINFIKELMGHTTVVKHQKVKYATETVIIIFYVIHVVLITHKITVLHLIKFVLCAISERRHYRKFCSNKNIHEI